MSRIAERLRESIESFLERVELDMELMGLALWFVFIGQLTVFAATGNGAWAQEALLKVCQILRLTDWIQARQALKAIIIWVDAMNDEVGETL